VREAIATHEFPFGFGQVAGELERHLGQVVLDHLEKRAITGLP